MQQFFSIFKQKKNLVNLIFLAILVISLPFGIDLARRQQILRSRANIVPVAFLQNQCISQRNGVAVATCADMSLQLTSPIGPPGTSDSENPCVEGVEDEKKSEKKEKKKDKDKTSQKKPCPTSSGEPSPSVTPSASPSCAPDDKKCLKNQEKQDKKDKKDKNKDKNDQSFLLNIIKNVYAGHLKQEGNFCEPDGVSLSREDGQGEHTFLKDCRDEGKTCQNGECVTGSCNDNDRIFVGCVSECGKEKWACPSNRSDVKTYDSPSDGDCRKQQFNSACTGSPSSGTGTCSIGNQSPSIPSVCKECILKKDTPLINSIKEKDPNKFNSCNETQLLNYLCNGGVSGAEGCPRQRLELCPSECDGWKPNASSNLCNKFQTPSIPKSCKECILEEDEDLLSSIVQQNPDGFKACSITQVFTYFCNGGIKGAEGCSKQRLDLCKNECSSWKPSASTRPSSSSRSDDRSNRDGSDASDSRDGGGGKNKSPNPSTPTESRTGITTSFKIAESPTELQNATAQPYTQDGQAVSFSFSSITPGTKTIFVEFIGFSDSKGKTPTTKVEQVSIQMVAPNPVISTAKCSLSSFGEGITVDLLGQNFGLDGGSLSIKEAGQNILGDVVQWKDTQVSATVNLPSDTDAEGRIINFVLTRKDNVFAEGSCAVGQFSALALGAKLFCRAPSSNIQEGVEVMIVEDTPKSEVKKEVVSIDKNGLVRGLETKFVNGKTYQVSVKSPRSLRRNSRPFVATDGTTQLVFQGNEGNDINKNKLPIGDIFPLDGGDGTINSQDGRELFLEWSGATPRVGVSQKLGDFNLDGKVNSIDWACMRYDFNESEDPPLQPLPRSAPSPAPSEEPSPSSTPSPSPQITGTPVSIQNFQFGPATLTIKKGTTVIWTNRDASPHSVISDSSLNFSGEILAQDSSHNFTFNQTGTFDYHCGLHPEMKGKIIVTD